MTEQEGAADVIYILAGDAPPSVEDMESLLSHSGLGETWYGRLITTAHGSRAWFVPPVRAGLFSPSHKLKIKQKELRHLEGHCLLGFEVDTATEKLKGTADIAKDLLRMVADTAVDRYLYDEWLQTIVKVAKKMMQL